MLEKIFITVLNMSITAGYVILAILLLRLCLRKAPKKYACMLWAAAAFRLVCPFSFSSLWSLFGLRLFDFSKAQEQSTSVMTYIPQDIGMEAVPEITVGLPGVNAVINGSLPAATPQYSANPLQIWIFIAACLWMIGLCVIGLYGAVSYAATCLRLRKAVRAEDGVWCSERVRSPFILGVIRPKIYLPYGLDETARQYVLAHERVHLGCGDHITKLCAFALLAIHWFNPLVWIAYACFIGDLEMRTDEAVLSSGADIRKAYSTVLLSVAANRRMPVSVPLAFGESAVKRRIQNILTWQPPKKSLTVVSACITLAVLAACAANPLPSADTPEPGGRVSAGQCFVTEKNLFSADGVLKDDSGCIYMLEDTCFIAFDRDSGEIMSMSSGPDGFVWQDADNPNLLMEKLYASAGTEAPDREYETIQYCGFGTDCALMKVDGALWLVVLAQNDLQAIYTLKETTSTPEQYGFNYVEWSFNPSYSAFLPAFRIEYGRMFETMTVSCENGSILVQDEDGRTRLCGQTAEVSNGEAVCWDPMPDAPTVVSDDTVSISVTLLTGEVLEGTMYMKGYRILADEPGVRMKFTARLVSDALVMRSNYELGGCVLTPIKTQLSPLDHPLVN